MLPIKTIRRETGLVEAICSHNVGHPVYGSVDWMRRVTGDDTWHIHNCDGCCADHEWEIATLRESIKIANDLILYHKTYIQKIESRRKNEN